jgi:hypothetical protein
MLSEFIEVNTGKVVSIIKHYNMKIYGGDALFILNLGSRWRCMVSFMHHPLYPRGKSSDSPWIGA